MPAKPKKKKPFGWVCEHHVNLFPKIYHSKEKAIYLHTNTLCKLTPLYKQEPKR